MECVREKSRCNRVGEKYLKICEGNRIWIAAPIRKLQRTYLVQECH